MPRLAGQEAFHGCTMTQELPMEMMWRLLQVPYGIM